MTPCCEIPLDKATGEEADAYKAFLDEYNNYWCMYFDPIALRIQITPNATFFETIILPLIDNSIYTAVVAYVGWNAGSAGHAAGAEAEHLQRRGQAEQAGIAERGGTRRPERGHEGGAANADNLKQLSWQCKTI